MGAQNARPASAGRASYEQSIRDTAERNGWAVALGGRFIVVSDDSTCGARYHRHRACVARHRLGGGAEAAHDARVELERQAMDRREYAGWFAEAGYGDMVARLLAGGSL